MDMVGEITGEAVLLANKNRSFCMIYHLKGVCDSNLRK